MVDSLLKRNPKIHPQLDFPDYKSSILRAPKNKRISFSSTTTEISGPAFNKDKSIPIAIESFKKDKRLYGEIVIYKERFIHIAGRLRLGQKSEENYVINVVPSTFNFQSLLEEMSDSEESKPSEDDYWIETIFNKVSLGLLDLSYEIPKEDKIYIDELIDKPVYFYRDLYEIDKEIKIEAGEFNFIDHPYFSVLVKVEEIAN